MAITGDQLVFFINLEGQIFEHAPGKIILPGAAQKNQVETLHVVARHLTIGLDGKSPDNHVTLRTAEPCEFLGRLEKQFSAIRSAPCAIDDHKRLGSVKIRRSTRAICSHLQGWWRPSAGERPSIILSHNEDLLRQWGLQLEMSLVYLHQQGCIAIDTHRVHVQLKDLHVPQQ